MEAKFCYDARFKKIASFFAFCVRQASKPAKRKAIFCPQYIQVGI
jgi:hypothetical protein